MITAVAAVGLTRLETSVGYRAFLGAKHPTVVRLDAFIERFGAGLPIAAVYRCDDRAPCRSVFDPSALRMAAAVTAALDATPGVRRVESVATSELLIPTSEGFDPRAFTEDGAAVADAAELAERAVLDPVWVGNLISPDARVGAVVADLDSSGSATSVAVFDALQTALAPFEAEGFAFHLVGGPVEFVVAGGELQGAMARIVPVMVALIAAVLWSLYRSAANVAAALVAMGAALVWTLGLMGWLGWPENSITQTLPPLVLVIGVCDGIHLLARYAAELAGAAAPDRAARQAALERATADVATPCIVTSVTTAAGLLTFTTSDLESFERFGVVSAFGVGAALLLTFSLLPVLCAWLPGTPAQLRRDSAGWDRALARLARFARRRATPLLLGAAVIGLICGHGMSRLSVDAAFEDLYGETSPVVRWVRFVEANLRPPDTLELEIVLPEGTRFEEPEAIATVRALEDDLAALPGLGDAHSVIEPLAWVNRLLHDDDPDFERTEASARANAQLLLLLAFNDPHRVDRWLSVDHRHVRVSVESGKEPQERLRRIMRAVHERVAALPSGWQVHVSGPLAVVHDMIEAIQQTQLRSFASAAVAVWGVVALFLRSAFWGLLAMVPTALPVVVTLGSMAFLGLALDVGTAMVAAVVIGIAVDDAVHLLVQFRRRRDRGLDADAAIEAALRHVGRALVTTSVALALGFFALLISPWQSIAGFGLVAGIAILSALAAVLVLLPAAIFAASRSRA